ncbi:MAG: Nif3-like dinuclear metal center hexameric protein [Haemophilus parainfluenzae]|jgi:dinuclear metal center protein, YbgI family|nr:MAG: Nif3-like dinuclear metal center hexameric protein [Haemophilus parainfluenzae]
MQREELIRYINCLLVIDSFADYAPNGLQVEGKKEIRKVALAVSASLNVINMALAWQADLLLVHHGFFWKNESAKICSWKKKRLHAILGAHLNVAAYHLPLDAHPILGNNASLAKVLGWQIEERVGEQNLLFLGTTEKAIEQGKLAISIENKLGRPAFLVGNPLKKVQKLAWCTGGGQGFFLEAIDQGAETFITGEASEAQYHFAQECGVGFIAAGHHATERYGIKTLGAHIAQEFKLDTHFIDENNPF